MYTPMGHITQGKSLQAEHPFLRNGDLKSHNKANRPLAPISKEPKPNMDEDNGDGFDGTGTSWRAGPATTWSRRPSP